MKKRALINFISSLSYQLLSLLVGLLIPKYYTEIFGSVYNGLNSSISQIMSLLSVLQFGISSVAIQQMFRYIAAQDQGMIAAVYRDAEKQYRRMGFVFLSVILPVTFLFPFLIRDELPYRVIVLFLLLRSVSSAMEYFFQTKYSLILIAHNKSYVVYWINILLLLLGTCLHLAVLFTARNIILYQSVALVVTLLRLLIVSVYVRKHFPFLRRSVLPAYAPSTDGKRKDVLIAEIAGMMIDSTDLLVLSTFSGLVSASIYSVYHFVVSGLGNILSSCREAVFAGIGKTYYQDFEQYRQRMDRFESVYLFLVFYLYSVCILLFTPFIEVYTARMDAEYVSIGLPIMFILAKMLVNFRIPAIVAVNTAGHFKQVKMYAVWEAVINLTLSLVLVSFLGIYGVLIGTIVGAAYRTPILIRYANRAILKREPRVFWKKIAAWLPLFLLCLAISLAVPFRCPDLLHWVLTALLCSVVLLVVCVGWVYITDRPTFRELIDTARRLLKARA